MALYPFAGLGNDLAGYARGRLQQRSAHFYPHPQEHSTVKEWAYGVAWATFGGEYTAYSDDRDTAERVQSFERPVLALESELAPRRWDVLTDFNKLLCARADLRVMVWDRDALEDGCAPLEPRLRDAVERMRGGGCSAAGERAASSTASIPTQHRRPYLGAITEIRWRPRPPLSRGRLRLRHTERMDPSVASPAELGPA